MSVQLTQLLNNKLGQSILFWTPKPKVLEPCNLRAELRALLSLCGNQEDTSYLPGIGNLTQREK